MQSRIPSSRKDQIDSMIECMEDMTATEVVRERMTFIISKESEINVIKSDDDL